MLFRRNQCNDRVSQVDLPAIESEVQDTLELRKDLHDNLVIMARTLLVDCLKLSKKHPVSNIGNGDVRIIHFNGEYNVVIHYSGGCLVLNRDAIELKGQLINLNAPYYYSTDTLKLFIHEVNDIRNLMPNAEGDQTHKAIGELATIGAK